MELTDIQQDALLEIFNIGAGHAAATLSRMVNEEVMLSVPTVQFLKLAQAAELLGTTRRISAVAQSFNGPFKLEAILIFSENETLEVVRLMIGEKIPLHELTDLEQDALIEIGNIILNSCIGTLSELFATEFTSSLPAFRLGTSEEVLGAGCEPDDHVVMLLHVDFGLERHNIRGHVVFLLDVSSLERLKERVNHFVYRAMGTDSQGAAH